MKILGSILESIFTKKTKVAIDRYPEFKTGFKTIGIENRETNGKFFEGVVEVAKDSNIGEPKTGCTIIHKDAIGIDNDKRQGSLGVTEAIARDFFTRHGKFDSIKFRIMSEKYAVESMSSIQVVRK